MAARSRRALTSFVLLASGLVAGGLTLGIAPAAVLPAAGAATCTSAGGVSVVVDYRELGGSTITACAADGGGKSAAAIFASVGVQLTYATRQPGFVCRVDGAPTSDPCVNASPSNAYWGLWWADGSRASWTYSSSGVGSLTVPAGGSVGWSWQQDRASGSSVPPSVAPPVQSAAPTSSATPTPTSSPTPSATATASPSAGGGGGGGGGSSQPSPTASPTSSPTRNGGGSSPSLSASPSASATASESPGPANTEDPTVASESPSDSTTTGGAGKGPVASESPSDSSTSGGAGEEPLASESPSDSTASSDPSTTPGQAAASEPSRLPARVTWAVLGLLGVAIAASAFVARRRRVSDAS